MNVDMYACMFYLCTYINTHIANKISIWSVFLPFCILLIDLSFSNFIPVLEFYFNLYCIFADLI